MIRFRQFLEEAVSDNFLYHSTSASNLDTMLRTDTMIAAKPRVLSVGRIREPAIFFSRSLNAAYWFGAHFRDEKHPVIIKFDKEKLSHNYSISPIQNNTQRDGKPEMELGRSGQRGILREEYILGNIKNVSKYIVDIEVVYNDTYKQIMRKRSAYNNIKKSGKVNLKPNVDLESK